ADVHQHHVRVDRSERVEHLRAVRARRRDDEAGVPVEDPFEAGPHERLVVDQGDGDHGPTLVIDADGAVRGSRASTRQPSSNGPAASAPPRDSTRSRMPIRPTPGAEGSGGGPPPSTTVTWTSSVPTPMSTVTGAPGACLAALDRLSCSTRYTA